MEVIIDLLSQSVSEEEILEDYPMLEKDDIRAFVAYVEAVLDNEDLEAISMEKGFRNF